MGFFKKAPKSTPMTPSLMLSFCFVLTHHLQSIFYFAAINLSSLQLICHLVAPLQTFLGAETEEQAL